MTSLLDPGELAELDRLRRHLSLRTASDGQGNRLSRRRGQSPEFVDHRGYAPGDDLRRLDWNVLARSNQTVIKRYRAEEEAAVRVVVDVSGSMGEGTPTKLRLAKRVAAACGYLALADGERAQVGTLGARGVELGAPKRGKGQLGALLQALDRVPLETATSEALAPDALMSTMLSRAGRPGVLILLTDALAANGDLDSWPRAIARARAAGHDVRVVQVLAPEDVDPPWDDDLALVDAESGSIVEVTFDAAARSAYVAHLEALVGALRDGCRRSKATYVRALSTEPLMPVVRRLGGGALD